jgi:hypothetical protein
VTTFTPAAWMMLTVLFFDLQPTNVRAYGADDDTAPPFSVLFSLWVTLTNRYWVTSDERRRPEMCTTTSVRPIR